MLPSANIPRFDDLPIPYRAIAGTLVIHPKGWDDTVPIERKRGAKDVGDAAGDVPASEASMFYTAYFKDGAPAESRPITFLFNGGPGSPTLWLHMGAFGPVRVETPDLTQLQHPEFKVLSQGRHTKKLRPGDLLGNRFRIELRD